MRDPLLFLQCIAKMMEELDISCEFDRCPPLELIAFRVREDTSDFCCIEKIIHLLERAASPQPP